MSEESKIQLATEVDATGAAQGFEKVKQGARDMAQGVVQAGQQAGKGMDAVTDGAKRAADGFTREEGRLRASIQRATLDLQTLGGTASQKLEAKVSLQGLDPAKFQPYLAALKQVEQAQQAIATAQRSSTFIDGLKQQADAIGKSKADLAEMQAAQLGLAAAAAPYIAKLREAEQAHHGFGGSAQFTTQQVQGLTHAVRGAFDSIASGQSPIRAIAVETGRLSGTFGGVGNAVQALTSLITPMRVALVAGAAAVGGLALAAAHAESALRDLNSVQAQLAGTGRSGLFDNAGLKAFIDELALAPGVTRESASAIVSELAKVHDVGGGIFKDLGRLTVDYAAATGQKVPEAAKALAQAFADPEKGAKELDKALGTLSSTQILTIERLARLGDVAGAQKAMVDALQGSVKGLADNAMTPLQRSTNELGNAWERLQTAFDHSDGLRTLNSLLATTINGVSWLIEHMNKLGGMSTVLSSIVPGTGAPAAIGNAIGSGIRSLFGADDTAKDASAKGRSASGPVTDLTGAKAGNTAATVASNRAVDDEIKRALEAGKAYKSQAGQIAELKEQRERMNKALKESIDLYGKNSPQARQLRDNVAGVNERIAAAQKKGAGGNEAQQVLDAQLAGQVKAVRDGLVAEREALAFSQHYLQGVYQAGQISLRDFYDQKRKAIEEGTAAEIAGLEAERVKVQAHIEATRRTSPKDKSKIEQDQNRLAEIDREQEKFRLAGARETVIANQEEAASFKQLSEQVLGYRANLLQLQGDEQGAAKLRAQVAIEQARILAKQSGGTISDKDVQAYAQAIQQTNDLAAARNRLNAASQLLAVEEDRINFLQSTGAVGELSALSQLGAARTARLGQIQKEVEALEKLAKERPLDLQLNVDASRARLELEKFRSELDPLKEKFDGIFRDAGANLFTELSTGTKPLQAIKNFANAIQREISATVGKELSAQLFGNDGALGGLGKLTADVLGGKERKGVSLDTTSAQASLSNLQTTGIEPATNSLANLSQVAEATAVSLRQVNGVDLPPIGQGTTGDFARMDRQQYSGEQSVMEQFQKVGESTDKLGSSTVSAATSVVRLASAAANGGNALQLLPGIIQSVMTAAQAASASGGGGGLIGGLVDLFTGGGGGAAASDIAFGSTSYADALAGGLIALSSGGYTGNVDPRKAAGIVHGKEYVFSAPAVAAIGVDRLERMHQKAKSGQLADSEVPGYSDGGYVSTPGDRFDAFSSAYLTPRQQAKAGDTHITHHHHYEVAVQATPGMSRQTATQRGAEIGRGIEMSMSRNGKRPGR